MGRSPWGFHSEEALPRGVACRLCRRAALTYQSRAAFTAALPFVFATLRNSWRARRSPKTPRFTLRASRKPNTTPELPGQHSEARSPANCRWTGLVSSRRCLRDTLVGVRLSRHASRSGRIARISLEPAVLLVGRSRSVQKPASGAGFPTACTRSVRWWNESVRRHSPG